MKIPSLLRKATVHADIENVDGSLDPVITVPASYTPLARPAWLTELAYDELQRLRSRGVADGNEHLTIIRNGVIASHHDGTNSVVSVPPGITLAGDIVLHNHPGCLNALSNADILLAAQRSTTICCITDDGSLYAARSLLSFSALLLGYEMCQIATCDAIDKTLLTFNKGLSCDDDKSRMNCAHFWNVVLARARFIEYTFALAPETTAIVSEVSKLIPPPPSGTYLES